MHPAYKALKTIPTDRIWCNRHGHYMRAEAFSKTSKNNANYFLQRGYRLGDPKILEVLNCIQCTGAPLVEMECSGCNRIKALMHFSKTQRNSDNPMCMTCIAEIENTRPESTPNKNDSSKETHSSDEDDMTVRGSNGSSVGQGGVSLSGYAYTSARSDYTADDTVISGWSESTNLSKPRAPRLEVGSSGFAKVRAGFRTVPVPRCEDDDVEYDKDDEDWDM